MTLPILTSKCMPPRLDARAIDRSRLLQRLEAKRASGGFCILLSAPPGYGKTTLLVQWHHRRTSRSAWLTLDHSDNDPFTFWTYLIFVLAEHLPDKGSALNLLLHQAPFPPPGLLAIELLNTLNNLSERITLVLDDYHVIENPVIHESVAYVLEHLPSSLQLIIASRSEPHFPWSRLRARQQLLEIRAADLEFSPSDTRYFLEQIAGIDLDDAALAVLHTRTEGWAAGLQLATLAMQHHPDKTRFVDSFAGSHRYILDYLFDEVISRQPDDVRRFLLATAILPQLNASLCDSVTDSTGSQAMLARLERGNLFVFPLDESRQVYRYHRLFTDLLVHRLETEFSHQDIVTFHQRAGSWHEQRGQIEQAIEHLLAGENPSHAADLVEQTARTSLNAGRVTTLLRWIERLPRQLLDTRPGLQFYHGWALFLSGQFENAVRILENTDRLLAAHEETTYLRGELNTLLMRAAVLTGNTEQAFAYAERARQWLPDTDQVSRVKLHSGLALAHFYRGEFGAAITHVNEAMELAQHLRIAFLAAHLAMLRGTILYEMGDCNRAQAAWEQVIGLQTVNNIRLPLAGAACVRLADIALIQNRLDEAASYFEQGLERCRLGGLADDVFIGQVLWAQFQAAHLNHAIAVEVLDQVRHAFDLEHSLPRTVLWIMASVKLDIARGEPLMAGDHISLLAPEVAENLPTVLRVVYLISVARVKLTSGQSDEAIALLSALAPFAMNQRLRHIEILLLHALAQYAQGKTTQAFISLEQALKLGEPEQIARPFLDEGQPMARLLQLGLWRSAWGPSRTRSFAKRLIDMFPVEFLDPVLFTEQPRNLPLKIGEPLTDREIEVLRLLADGLSNREIAAALILSVGTIKTHIHHLCAKLEADNRTHAVARARALKLL